MLIYAEIAYGRVFHAGTMSSLLVSFAPTIILAVGMTFVIISGGIDLSVGAVVAFSSVAGVMLMNIGVNGWLSMLLMIVFGAVFGLISGVMIQYFDVQPFIATLAMMFLARGLASILSTTPVIAPEDSPIHLLATDWKIVDGPKVNDFTVTPGADHRAPRRPRRLLLHAPQPFGPHGLRDRRQRVVGAVDGSAGRPRAYLGSTSSPAPSLASQRSSTPPRSAARRRT